MRKKINQKLLDIIDKYFDTVEDKDLALTYILCVEANTILTLYRLQIFKTKDDEDKLIEKLSNRCKILFVDEDVDAIGSQRKYKLKISLWTDKVEQDLYDEYYKSLVKSPKMVMHKGRLVNSKEGKDAFQEIQNSIKEFDLSRFVDSTINYYVKEGQYAKSLPKFLTELGMGWYESYQPVKSNLI